MKALVCNAYGPPDSLRIEARADPVAGAGEVLVDIRAAGINFPDVLMIAGQYQVKTPPPFVPGSEAAGVIAAVGANVERLRPGDCVIVTPSLGAFAEKCAARALVHALPASMSFERAGFTVTHATTFHAFRSTELRARRDCVRARRRRRRRRGRGGNRQGARRASSPPPAARSWSLPVRPAPTKRSTTRDVAAGRGEGSDGRAWRGRGL
jgi:hypothetical protein